MKTLYLKIFTIIFLYLFLSACGTIDEESGKKSHIYREEISQLIYKNKNLNNPMILANKIFEKFPKPVQNRLNKDIKNFKIQYSEHLKYLEKYGWDEAKKKLGTKMAQPYKTDLISLEQFRDECNPFIIKLVNIALKELGMGQLTMAVFGTPGWNSDVDIGMRSKGDVELNTGDMVLAKIFCDLFTLQVIKHLPGKALDTEWYISLMFEADKLKSKKAKKKFFTIDYIMALTQTYDGIKEHKDTWETYKNVSLKKLSLEKDKNTINFIFKEIEEWFLKLEKNGADKKKKKKTNNKKSPDKKRQLLRAHKSLREWFKNKAHRKDDLSNKDNDKEPHARYHQKVLSLYPKILALGNICSEYERIIDHYEKGKGKLDKHLQNIYDELSHPSIDRLRLEHDIFYAILNSLQLDGTNSWSELNLTLYKQRLDRERERLIKKYGSIYKNELLKNFGDREDILLKEVFKKRNELSAQLKYQNPPKIDEAFIASIERYGQYLHTIHASDNDIIAASKYLLRVTTGLKHVLDQAVSTLDIDDSEKERLYKYVLKYHHIAQELEKCKRKIVLSNIAAKNILAKKIEEIGHSNDSREKIKENLEPIFNMFKKNGKYFDTLLKKSEKMAILSNHLSKLNYIETVHNPDKIITGQTCPSNSEIHNILKAYVGYKKEKYPELLPLHERACQITLDYFRLNKKRKIKKLTLKLHKLTTAIHGALSGQNLIPTLSYGTAENLFHKTQLWQ